MESRTSAHPDLLPSSLLCAPPSTPSRPTAASQASSEHNQRTDLTQKPTHTPTPYLLSFPVQAAGAELVPCKASPRETQEHPFQTDRFTLNYEIASVPYQQLPAVSALPEGTITEVGTRSMQVMCTALKATLISCSFSQKITNG